MIINLQNPILQSSFRENDGKNIFKDISTIYLKEPNSNIVLSHYHYFRKAFIRASMDFVNNNKSQEASQDKGEVTAKAIGLVLFDGNQELITRCNQLIKSIAYKSNDFSNFNLLNDDDIQNLDIADWEVIITSFLHCYWLKGWLNF